MPARRNTASCWDRLLASMSISSSSSRTSLRTVLQQLENPDADRVAEGTEELGLRLIERNRHG